MSAASAAATAIRAFIRRIDRIALALVIAAVILRVVWVFDARVAPVDDSAFYYNHASDLAAGRGYIHPQTGEPSAFLPPGYPLLLALVFVVTGPSVLAGALLNVALAGAGLAATYGLARRFFGVWAGRIALGTLAFFPSQVVYTPALLPDILFTALVMGALWAGMPRERTAANWHWIVCGALIGAAVLTAPKAILLVPALALFWRSGTTWRAAGIRTAMAVAALAVVVTPWTVRNAIHFSEPLLISTNGGVNLWVGNNPEASGGWMPWETGSTGWDYPEDEVAANSEFLRRGIEYAFEHPGATLGLWPEKLDETFKQDFSYLGHFSLVPRDRPLLDWMDGGRLERVVDRYYKSFVWLSVAGALVLVASRHRGSWLVLPAVALAAPIVIFFGLDRYHVPLLPLMAVSLGGGAETIACAVRTRTSERRREREPGVASNPSIPHPSVEPDDSAAGATPGESG